MFSIFFVDLAGALVHYYMDNYYGNNHYIKKIADIIMIILPCLLTTILS